VNEILIPISLFAGLTIVLCLFFWFRYRMRSDLQKTIRTAIDKGQELSPEIIDRIGQPKAGKDRDLRLAMIWIAIGVALTVFGFSIPEEEANQIFLGIAAFPFSLGVAFLILWKFTDRQ
jgi:hypothetical protein